jgi:type VI secretion system protein ImpC
MSQTLSDGTPEAAPAIEVTLLDRILDQGGLVRVARLDPDADEAAKAEAARAEAQARSKALGLLKEFVDRVVANTSTVSQDVTQRINDCIAEIDRLISVQLNEVIHHPDCQRLEASWRGLHDLVMNTETGVRLKLRLLNVSKSDLLKDLKNAIEFDQSALFKKVYEDEYGTFGGNPYSVLVGDFEFGPAAQDVELLAKISNVAAAAHAPFITAASPAMFFMDSFTDLPAPRDLAKIFESSDFADWRAFRASEDSRYVALTMPRVLQRLPYGKDTVPVEGMGFEEDVDGTDHSKYLWGSSAYKLALRITDAYAMYGWTAAIRGVEGGGKVEGLPAHSYKVYKNKPDDKSKALYCPTEIAITDRREKELNDLGFLALLHHKGENFAAFFGGQTAQKPNTDYASDKANANARLSAMLPYVLTASRFAHYLKVSMRDKIGSFMTKENVQTFLNLWIGEYVLGKDDAGQALKARYPLREARVDVFDTPGKPGVYTATVFLRPHFQLEELTTSIRLVAELPPPVAA